eukprot:gb/GEZN01010843.1/.p1 GENE.gb/GEZN01010843.1/~~gb/GEZN01010843.1/.p1  ORF type:complete len:350 (+),score=61.57 gb/GEZN01010843.1/:147-1052(+)
MLSKESVSSRMGGEGISFTEFSYQILQAYDFLELFEKKECILQVGGSDQWGNILAGLHLIRAKHGGHCNDLQHKHDKQRAPHHAEAFGLTLTLLTTSQGEKLGKSLGNSALWLCPSRCSPFRFYQHLLNTADGDVSKLLRLLTLLPLEEIDTLLREHQLWPEKRVAQHALARETTRLVHGEKALSKAVDATIAIFSEAYTDLSLEDLSACLLDGTELEICLEDMMSHPVDLTELAVQAKLFTSKSEGRRLIQAGGLYLNGKRLLPFEGARKLLSSDLLHGRIAILRCGKKRPLVIHARPKA